MQAASNVHADHIWPAGRTFPTSALVAESNVVKIVASEQVFVKEGCAPGMDLQGPDFL